MPSSKHLATNHHQQFIAGSMISVMLLFHTEKCEATPHEEHFFAYSWRQAAQSSSKKWSHTLMLSDLPGKAKLDEMDRAKVLQVAEDDNSSSTVSHRGNFTEVNKSAVQKIKNLDIISEIEIPSAWKRVESTSSSGHSIFFCRSPNEATKIIFFVRNRPIDEKSAASFRDIVNSSYPTPRLLYSDKFEVKAENIEMFKNLASALGSNSVGDNQLSGPSIGQQSRRPDFHLNGARLETLNGKKVIAIDGWFTQLDERAEIKIGPHGPLKRYYSGIFFDADGKATKVDELYLVPDTQIAFLDSKSTFLEAIHSIKWR